MTPLSLHSFLVFLFRLADFIPSADDSFLIRRDMGRGGQSFQRQQGQEKREEDTATTTLFLNGHRFTAPYVIDLLCYGHDFWVQTSPGSVHRLRWIGGKGELIDVRSEDGNWKAWLPRSSVIDMAVTS